MCLLWTTLERGSVREKSTDVVVYNQSSLWILVVIIWVDICCLWHLPSFVVKVQVFCLGEKAALIEILDRFKWPYLSHRVTNHYVPHRWGHWVGVCNFLLFLFFPLPPLPGNNDQEDKNHCTDTKVNSSAWAWSCFICLFVFSGFLMDKIWPLIL